MSAAPHTYNENSIQNIRRVGRHLTLNHRNRLSSTIQPLLSIAVVSLHIQRNVNILTRGFIILIIIVIIIILHIIIIIVILNRILTVIIITIRRMVPLRVIQSIIINPRQIIQPIVLRLRRILIIILQY